MDMHTSFATDQKILLLTQQAAADPGIAQKIQKQLREGKDVIITTGLLKAIPEKIAEICELRCSDLKAIVNDFGKHGKSGREIIIPQVLYQTNDSWEIVSAGRPLSGGVSGYPILHKALYGKGYLYVLTIPDDFGNLYDYPTGALNEIRKTMSQDLDFYLEGTSKVSLFLYDNKTLIVENFNDEPVEMNLVANCDAKTLTNLEDGTTVQAVAKEETQKKKKVTVQRFTVKLKPHSYMAFSY